MSAPINNGGPAFPVYSVAWKEKGEDCVAIGTHGMTLRDYFAGQALMGNNANTDAKFCYVWMNAKGERRLLEPGSTPCARVVEGWEIVETPLQRMAESMYNQADAMIAARNKTVT